MVKIFIERMNETNNIEKPIYKFQLSVKESMTWSFLYVEKQKKGKADKGQSLRVEGLLEANRRVVQCPEPS